MTRAETELSTARRGARRSCALRDWPVTCGCETRVVRRRLTVRERGVLERLLAEDFASAEVYRAQVDAALGRRRMRLRL